MSGRLSPTDIGELVLLLAKAAEHRRELGDLESQRLTICTRITVVSDDLGLATKRIRDLIREMDVASPGNWGFEDRLIAVIDLLRQHIEVQRPAPVPAKSGWDLTVGQRSYRREGHKIVSDGGVDLILDPSTSHADMIHLMVAFVYGLNRDRGYEQADPILGDWAKQIKEMK